MLSSKLFNDAVARGLHDVLAGTINAAIRAMGGATPTAILFDLPSTTVGNIAKVLNSDNIEVQQVAQIFRDPSLRPSRVKSILADTNITADRAQAILYSMVDQGFYDKLLDIFTFDRADALYTTSTTITTGINLLKNVSVASAVTLTLEASPCTIVANTITNSGTITTNVVKGTGGAAGAAGAGAGGAGRHGIILLARNISTGTVTADGVAGGNGSTVAASGTGAAGGAGLFWEISGYPAGFGGSGGRIDTYSPGGAGSKNAGGGGGTRYLYPYSNAGGGGGNATVVSYPSASALLSDLLKAVCDYWLVNILGRTPTTTKSIPALGGSGGGGGGAADGYGAGGGGGGGGGQVIIYGTSVTAGTISARGMAGGNGGAEGAYDCAGGGAGGGLVYVFYKSLTGTFTFNVAGGAGGTGDANGGAGTAGSAATFAV
jgi:hypothetical protein